MCQPTAMLIASTPAHAASRARRRRRRVEAVGQQRAHERGRATPRSRRSRRSACAGPVEDSIASHSQLTAPSRPRTATAASSHAGLGRDDGQPEHGHGQHDDDLAARHPPSVHRQRARTWRSASRRRRRPRPPSARPSGGRRASRCRAAPATTPGSTPPSAEVAVDDESGQAAAAADDVDACPTTENSPVSAKWSPVAYTVQPPYQKRWATR